jgi:hypothetical protein
VVRGWVVVGSLLLAPVVLWATTQPLDSRFASSTATLASLANIAALTGTAAFASNLVIGSRIRPIVRLFGGLETMYAAHRRLGVDAFALRAAHAGWQPGTPPRESAEGARDPHLRPTGDEREPHQAVPRDLVPRNAIHFEDFSFLGQQPAAHTPKRMTR